MIITSTILEEPDAAGMDFYRLLKDLLIHNKFYIDFTSRSGAKVRIAGHY